MGPIISELNERKRILDTEIQILIKWVEDSVRFNDAMKQGLKKSLKLVQTLASVFPVGQPLLGAGVNIAADLGLAFIKKGNIDFRDVISGVGDIVDVIEKMSMKSRISHWDSRGEHESNYSRSPCLLQF